MEEKEEKKVVSKNKKIFRIVLESFIGVCMVSLFALTCFQFYLTVYLKPFWVDGQSMYPTLNYDAKNEDGTRKEFNAGVIDNAYDIDCGVMNTHKKAIDKIKRFDIIITRYDESDTEYIKRVIGFPGETIEFVNAGAGNEHNGDLYINGVYTVQPLDADLVRNGLYYTNVYHLGDNEYFVAGDNRIGSNSDDCRKELGKEKHIKKEYIKGKIVALTGKCKIRVNSKTGANEPYKHKYHWPRFMK